MWMAVDFVAYVDDVVVAVGADAERADEPAPDAEPSLLAKGLAELEERAFARWSRRLRPAGRRCDTRRTAPRCGQGGELGSQPLVVRAVAAYRRRAYPISGFF